MTASADLPWSVLDLPRPPSVNRFVAKLGNMSPAVRDWVKQCDRYVMASRQRPTKIRGPFQIEITWNIDQFGRFDWDNPVKPLMDYLQRIEVIENDKWCRDGHVGWGPTPLGCRLRLRPWVAVYSEKVRIDETGEFHGR
jgi:Holliday junction resolvase RusA-like endonuclease